MHAVPSLMVRTALSATPLVSDLFGVDLSCGHAISIIAALNSSDPSV